LRPRLTAGLPLSRRRSARAHVNHRTNSEESDIYAAWPFICSQPGRVYARWLFLALRTSENAVWAKFGIAPLRTAQDRQPASKKSGRPGKRGKERRPPQHCDTHNPKAAKRAAPLPGDHNHLCQVAISRSSLSPGPVGENFSGSWSVTSRNTLIHNAATNATKSPRFEAEGAAKCRRTRRVACYSELPRITLMRLSEKGVLGSNSLL
jgi:hypothetical protein